LESASPPGRIADAAAGAEAEARTQAAGFHWDPVTGFTTSTPAPPRRRGRPLTVLAAEDGTSLFDSLDDDRVKFFRVGQATPEPPDMVLLTRTEIPAEDAQGLTLPAEVWRRLRSGETKLLLDACSEGSRHTSDRAAKWRRFMAAAGLDPANAVYLTQDRGFRADDLAHRRAMGETEPGFHVLVHDRFIQDLFAEIQDSGEAVFERRLGAYAARPAVRERRFICLNNTFRALRALLILSLMRDGLWDRGYISVGKIGLQRNQMLKRMRGVGPLRPLAEELIPLLDRLEALSPTYVGLGGKEPWHGSARRMVIPRMFEEYGQSWFTIVTETDGSERLHRITEKPFKPLLCFHPFIVMGSVGSLRLVRDFGFKTFAGFFDEAYDDETDLKARFEMVLDQIVGLCAADEAELALRSEAVARQVVFNARWGLTQLPRLFRERINPVLVDHLIDFARGSGRP
jgi:hypothetical protein